jgi:hypothetical protein
MDRRIAVSSRVLPISVCVTAATGDHDPRNIAEEVKERELWKISTIQQRRLHFGSDPAREQMQT